jgi:branched-chain amino acid transport system ATP-binding protein
MLVIGRALMLTPDLLLLDESSLGLDPIEVKELINTIKLINREKGTSVLLVEQNLREVFSIAQKAYVMKVGKIVLENSDPAILLSNEELRKSYLT